MVKNAASSCIAHAARKDRVAREAFHGLGEAREEGGLGGGLHKDTRLGGDVVERTAPGGGDDGQADAHGFQDHGAAAFKDAGQDEAICIRDHAGRFRLFPPTGKCDAVARSGRHRDCGEPFALGSVADDRETDLWQMRQSGQRAYCQIDALPVDETAHEHHLKTVCRTVSVFAPGLPEFGIDAILDQFGHLAADH